MAEPIRWGILGAADFAARKMAGALHVANGGTLVALATGSPDKAGAFRQIAPDLRVLEDYQALLADDGVDAVYIPLPNSLHEEWALAALEAGKHVLVEKPVAMSTEGVDALIAARDRAGRLAAEAFMIVHHPQWRFVREWLAQGAVGPVRRVDVAFSFDNRDPENIRNRPEVGGGALRDIGVYAFGGVRFATRAEPEQVSARIDWDGGIDATVAVDARFEGFDYAAFLSMRLHPRQEVVFHGEAGLIRMTAPFNPQAFGEAQVVLERPDFETLVRRFPAARHYEQQVAAFNRSAAAGLDYPCPLEFSRGTQAMIDAAFASCGPSSS